jgi:hypothetical protein
MNMGLESYTWLFLVGFAVVMILVIGLLVFFAKYLKDE